MSPALFKILDFIRARVLRRIVDLPSMTEIKERQKW
jgi:hypothetical protein